MKKAIICIIILLGGCANKGGDSGVNPQQCKAVQSGCLFGGIYDEWIREGGEMICSCHRMHKNPEAKF